MKPNIKKLLILNAPYLLFVYLFDKVGQAVRLSPGADLSGKLLSIGSGFSAAFSNALPSFAPMDLLIGIVGAVVIRLAVYVKGKNAKKYRKGMEYGSARWGNAEDIKPYIDPIFENNVLLTQTERLMMSSRPKHPKYARNKNVLVIGGSGSGKTRFFVKPNLMQMHSSYVVTDPKGTVLIECGKLLQRGGYKIKVLNTINFKKSMRYNPFAYLRSEKDILKLVNTIIANTKGDGEKSGEDFWVKSERLFYCALIGYIWYEAPENEKNFTTLLEMINASEAREDDPEFQSPVVCFDIKQLGKQLKKLGMLIVQDQVWNRVTVNRAEKKATRYYMDEFHLLLKEEQTAAYSVEIWKRFRKWGGIPTAITQNVKDLLSSREVENIFGATR